MAISQYKTSKGEVRYKATVWKNNRPGKAKSFRRKVDAVEWSKRESISIEDERVGRMKGNRISLGEFFRDVYWPNRKIRGGTAKDYERIFRNHIGPKFGHRPLGEIEPEEWDRFLTGLITEARSKSRINRIHATCSAIYKMALRMRYVSSNPLLAVGWHREDLSGDFDYWSYEDVSTFLQWAYAHVPERAVMYQALYKLGLRSSEAIGLKRDCLDLISGSVQIRRSFCKATRTLLSTTKNGHRRILGLNPGLKNELVRYISTHQSEFVFSFAGGPYSYETLEARFKRDQEESGVRRITLHSLRHTFASHFMMGNGNIYDLKTLMGHSTVETTMRYAHLAPGHLHSKAAMVSFEKPQDNNVLRLKIETPNHDPTIEQFVDGQTANQLP